MRAPRVLLITDAAFPEARTLEVIDVVAEALPRGAFGVQLRDKGLDPEARERWARRLRASTRAHGASFVVNGDVALAREVAADGVHFPSGVLRAALDGASELWRSVAAHDDREVADARAAGVDAVLVSPIFATPGKGPPRGPGAITTAVACAGERVAVYALGGVSPREASACYEAGAYGVAVIRALLGAVDPAAAALALLAGSGEA